MNVHGRHPWQTSEIQALTGSGYSSLPVLNVSYYNNTAFVGASVKTSITPEVDFDLNTFRGTNSPDASAGVSSTGYGILWNGFIQNVPSAAASSSQAGNNFVFFLTSDDVACLWIGSQKIIDKESPGLSTVTGACMLPPNQPIPITIQYTHSTTGPASMHIHWLSAPGIGNVLQIVPAPARSGQ